MALANTYRAGQTTYPVSQGGTVPDALIPPLFVKWANSLEPVNTPILSKIRKGKPKNQRTFFWGQSAVTPIETTLATALADGTGTTVAVKLGDGVLFQKWTKFAIYDPIAGTNPPVYDLSKKELCWCTVDPTSDSITAVARAQGGTAGIAHPVGSKIEIMGVTEPQLQDHTVSPVTTGFTYQNNFERFGGGVRIDKAARSQDTYEGSDDKLNRDMRNEQIRLNRMLERSVISGGRQPGNPATPLPEMMGGFLSYITSNVYNMGGPTVLLTVSKLDAAMADMWTKVDDSFTKTWLMSMNTARIFDTFLNPARQATASETTITNYVEKIRLRTGTYDFMVSRNFPDGIIGIVDLGLMELCPFEGLDWHTHTHYTDGEYDWQSQTGDFSLMVENERAMGIITGFNPSISAYPGADYLT
jgi:Family of unknown function (DUF5309)